MQSSKYCIFRRLAYQTICFSSQHVGYAQAWLCSAGCSYIFSRSDDIEILIKGSMAVSQYDVTPLPVELTALDAQKEPTSHVLLRRSIRYIQRCSVSHIMYSSSIHSEKDFGPSILFAAGGSIWILEVGGCSGIQSS